MLSVLNKLQDITSKNPDKLLYSFLDLNGNELEKYTYASFMERVDIIASHLAEYPSLKGNARVLLAYPPGLEMICAFFACARLGLIPVPVYPPTSNSFQSALQKIGHIIRDCKATAVLTGQEYYWSFQLNLERNKISENLLNSCIPGNLEWINTDVFTYPSKKGFIPGHSDIFFLQYTSGSTSDPKGVMVSHKNILYNCNLVSDHLPVCASWLPQYHDMGLIGYYIFCALQSGTTYGFAPVDFIQRPSLWLETMHKYRCTASSAPNFAYEYVLQPGKLPGTLLENLDLSNLEFLMTAAEPVRPATYEKFLSFFKPYGLNPKSYFAAYGLAENTLAVSNYGRTHLKLDKESLNQNRMKIASPVAPADSVVEIMSCGTFLGDSNIRIVHPENCTELANGDLGEIWINGQSKCMGYWNKPELTQKMFQATIQGENQHIHNFLRTGDIGFIWDEELYICGRVKDMIIIRGLNYFPQDIEKIVEESSDLIRKTCVAAFGIEENGSEKLVVVAGVKNQKQLPDAHHIADEIRKQLNINASCISFILAREVPKTSSGKIMRQRIKQDWMQGSINIISDYKLNEIPGPEKIPGKKLSPFEEIKNKYSFTGDETTTLGNALDSLDLVILMHDIKEKLNDKGAMALARHIDIKLVQEISVSELLELGAQFEQSSGLAILRLKKMLERMQEDYNEMEVRAMLSDAKYRGPMLSMMEALPGNDILLTGGTGFLGPFLLKSLLEQTSGNIYVLVRGADTEKAQERIWAAQKAAFGNLHPGNSIHSHRIIPICGNLDQPELGMDNITYQSLCRSVGRIFHNGAMVNYLYNYEKMKPVNVAGTHELVQFALTGCPKEFNHISTTFIFGWAVKDVLFERNSNDSIDLLDFGYSQSKWVSEQIVMDAMKQGLQVRIFRPALISPSIHGYGHNFDIAIRLLAFMIKYGIGVDAKNQVSFTPADVVANNIVAISNLPDSINHTFHITRDNYNNMAEITEMITGITGQKFKTFKLHQFVPEVLSRCTKSDMLFPLLDFLVRSVDKINAMEFKRYDNHNYQKFRNATPMGLPDPSLEETVGGIIRFLERNKALNTSLVTA